MVHCFLLHRSLFPSSLFGNCTETKPKAFLPAQFLALLNLMQNTKRSACHPPRDTRAVAEEATKKCLKRTFHRKFPSLQSSLGSLTATIMSIASTTQEEEAAADPENYRPISKSLQSHRKGIFATLIVLIGLCASGTILAFGLLAVEQEQDSLFQQRATDIANSIATVWKSYEIFGLWIKESCRYSGTDADTIHQQLGICTHEEFSELHEYLQSVGLSYQAAELLVNVTHKQRPAIENASRVYYNENYPDYEYVGVRGVQTDARTGVNSIIPQEKRYYYFMVHYVEPLRGNELVVDLNSYARRGSRLAIDKAVSTHQPVLTEPFRLVQETAENGTSAKL